MLRPFFAGQEMMRVRGEGDPSGVYGRDMVGPIPRL